MLARLASFRISLIAFLIACAACACCFSHAEAAWPLNGLPISTVPGAQTAPVIVQDFSGGAVIVWSDARFGDSDIYAQRVDSSGVPQWSAGGVAVCYAANAQINPVAVYTFDGGATVMWQDFRDGLNYHMYAQRISGAGLTQWAANGVALTPSLSPQSSPALISDGVFSFTDPTGYIALWTHGSGSNQNLQMQHIDANGAGIWSAKGTDLADAQAIEAVMVTDGVGALSVRKGAVVAWSQPGVGTGYDLYCRRMDGSGVAQWAAGGVPVCALTGDQRSASIANVGNSNIVIGWQDARTGENDLYAQELNSSGATQWLANGLPICRATGDQSGVKIAHDGVNGIFAVWVDSRSGVPKIYAQRLDPTGQRLWALDGIPICTAPGSQVSPTLVALPGGLLVAWVDNRSGTNGDLYTQRIDANGNLLWGATGVPLCVDPSNPSTVAGTYDGSDGALWTWSDARNGNDDIYATRAVTQGVADVPSAPPAGLRLDFLSANPARHGVKLSLELPQSGEAQLDVIDTSGRRVRRLPESGTFEAGVHAIRWDGNDDSGAPTAPGVYFVRASIGSRTLVTKVVGLR
jgi:hypothetical protein